jgi:radical SAM protein with 4Fe4S-binding SPASM domain
MTRQVGFMDMGLFRRVIDQAKDYTDFAWLHLFGESLFHPQLEEAISYCADSGVKSGLSTNATLLDEEKAHLLLRSKLNRLILSIDGTHVDTYEKLRRGAHFETVRANIQHFFQFKKKLNNTRMRAEVQIIIMQETWPEIEEFKRQWNGLADGVYVKYFCRWANQNESISHLARSEKKLPMLVGPRYPCEFLWKNGVVLWNGDVVPCCMDFDGKAVLGNLRRETLKEIWNSSRARQLRAAHRRHDFDNPLCKDCTEWLGGPRDWLYPVSRRFYPLSKTFCKVLGSRLLRTLCKVRRT